MLHLHSQTPRTHNKLKPSRIPSKRAEAGRREAALPRCFETSFTFNSSKETMNISGQRRDQLSELASPPATLIWFAETQGEQGKQLGREDSKIAIFFLITFLFYNCTSNFVTRNLIFFIIQINSCKISLAMLSKCSWRDYAWKQLTPLYRWIPGLLDSRMN